MFGALSLVVSGLVLAAAVVSTIGMTVEDAQVTGYTRDRLSDLVDPRLRATSRDEGRSCPPRLDQFPTVAVRVKLDDDD